jgi:hypothetical protein
VTTDTHMHLFGDGRVVCQSRTVSSFGDDVFPERHGRWYTQNGLLYFEFYDGSRSVHQYVAYLIGCNRRSANSRCGCVSGNVESRAPGSDPVTRSVSPDCAAATGRTIAVNGVRDADRSGSQTLTPELMDHRRHTNCTHGGESSTVADVRIALPSGGRRRLSDPEHPPRSGTERPEHLILAVGASSTPR